MSGTYEPKELERLQETLLEMLADFQTICEKYKIRWFGIAGTGLGAIRHGGFIPWDDDIDIAIPRKDFERFVRIVDRDWKEKYYILNTEHVPNYPLHTTRMCKVGTTFIEEPFKNVDMPCGIFLDLYPYDNLADNELLYKAQIWHAWVLSKLLILRQIDEPVLFQTGWKKELILTACKVIHKGMKCLGMDGEKLYWRGQRIARRYNHKKTKRIGFPFDTNPEWNTFPVKEVFPCKKLTFGTLDIPFPKDCDKMLTRMYGADYMTPPPPEKRKTHHPYKLEFEKTDG